MTLKKNTGRKILRNMRPTVLQQCGFAERILPFLVAFVFSLNALSALSSPEYPEFPESSSPSQTPLDSAFYARYPYVIVINEGDDVEISDDDFYRNAASVQFKSSKYDLPAEDLVVRELRETVLPHRTEKRPSQDHGLSEYGLSANAEPGI